MRLKKCVMLFSLMSFGGVSGAELDPAQEPWFERYCQQKNAPEVTEMLLNESGEPELLEGFVDLLAAGNLEDWEMKGGRAKFALKEGVLIGTCIPGEASSYLCTKRKDYRDFIFSGEVKWEVDLNSGVMFRGKSNEKHAVYGPQVEMEGIVNSRGWSGAIYGQSCGGYWYPLWLKEHAAARKALKKKGWNRVTIEARGKVVKTWVNGIPASHWAGSGEYLSGYLGVQVHKAKVGEVLWRNLKVKELPSEQERLAELDAYWAELSRTVQEGDFKGYEAALHPEGVLVSGSQKKSSRLAMALAGWKKDFDRTKSGEMRAEVEFRFSQRLGDENTAHETGMFRYASAMRGGEMEEVYIHLEALLVKKEGWKIMMEFQRGKGTREEWESLKR